MTSTQQIKDTHINLMWIDNAFVNRNTRSGPLDAEPQQFIFAIETCKEIMIHLLDPIFPPAHTVTVSSLRWTH